MVRGSAGRDLSLTRDYRRTDLAREVPEGLDDEQGHLIGDLSVGTFNVVGPSSATGDRLS